MILDTIANIERYRSLSLNMSKAIDFIISGDAMNQPAGKIEIAGDDVFLLMNEYETKDQSDCKTESHRKYIDIQWMIDGSEKVGFSFLDNQKITESYNHENDYTFYDASLDYFELKQGWFAIFFPTDLHCPSIALQNHIKIRKAVFKVKV
jgi:YhcH/YjgK/YiaL family protein